MECLLCAQWAQMPYARKWSTPTTVEQTEGALVIGYWLGTRHHNQPLCERHNALLRAFDESFTQPAPEVTPPPPPPPPPPVPVQPQLAAVRTVTIREDTIRTAQSLLSGHHGRQPVLSPTEPFTIGPGPLPNQNTAVPTQQPPPVQPAPIQAAPVQPPPPPQPPIDPLKILNGEMDPLKVPPAVIQSEPVTVPAPQGPIDATAMALEAAKAPPTEGVRVTTECPKCGLPLGVGELHEC